MTHIASVPVATLFRSLDVYGSCMGVDLDQKVGGTKSENHWFEKPSFFKPSKTSKVQMLGVLFFYLSCNL